MPTSTRGVNTMRKRLPQPLMFHGATKPKSSGMNRSQSTPNRIEVITLATMTMVTRMRNAHPPVLSSLP